MKATITAVGFDPEAQRALLVCEKWKQQAKKKLLDMKKAVRGVGITRKRASKRKSK